MYFCVFHHCSIHVSVSNALKTNKVKNEVNIGSMP